jgi:hypothetical protein
MALNVNYIVILNINYFMTLNVDYFMDTKCKLLYGHYM